MKYFTPERLLRLQDVTDEQAFLSASRDWEGAAAAYAAHLEAVRAKLPGSLRRLLGRVSLHDARVLGIWQTQSRLTVVLQPEAPGANLLVLTYSLVAAPVINTEALAESCRSMPVTWLYDEVDVKTAEDEGGRRRGNWAFAHDIVLSNGWEMRLRFSRLAVTRPAALLPRSPDLPPAARAVLPQSA